MCLFQQVDINMISGSELIARIGHCSQESTIKIEDTGREVGKGSAFVISTGSALATHSKQLASGTFSTQTFTEGDPIGFAEVIALQEQSLKFREIESVSLIQIAGEDIKKAVDESGFLVKEMIRYSVFRVFERSRNRFNTIFEDKLIKKYRKTILRIPYSKGDKIFYSKSDPDSIFFIEKGNVKLLTNNGNVLTTLRPTDCFGEGSLISNQHRSMTAVAAVDCVLIKLPGSKVEAEIGKEHPLVQLALLQLVKRVHLMNQMRLIESGDSVYSG